MYDTIFDAGRATYEQWVCQVLVASELTGLSTLGALARDSIEVIWKINGRWYMVPLTGLSLVLEHGRAREKCSPCGI